MHPDDDEGAGDAAEDPVAALEQLEAAGKDDTLMLSPSDYREIFTDRRRELFRTIRERQDEQLSVTGLADLLGRDKAAVSRDLNVLFEYAVIDFEEQGTRKIPVPRHAEVVTEPI